MLTRRRFLNDASAAGLLAATGVLAPAWARGVPAQTMTDVDLTIAETAFSANGRRGIATTINGGVPGPLLRFREGDDVTLRVTNRLKEDTSIHWHGILLPNGMDGVPGVNFDGIKPGQTFVYKFPVRQSGTYWYHSHSGLQEQLGHYGPMIIDPAGEDRVAYDREHVIVLSDWTFENPDRVFAKLKKDADYYNRSKRTAGDFLRDARANGLGATMRERRKWAEMRMTPTDIADVTGATYTYLMNGVDPASNWTGLFRPGERVRLRIINASAMTYFDVRIPGLPMTVVQADGIDVEPVETDEIRIAVAETYDVIIEPTGDAHTVFAETMDRSGFARGVLAVRNGLVAPTPARRAPPRRDMASMGHGGHDMAADADSDAVHDMSAAAEPADGAADHAAMGHDMGAAGAAAAKPIRHDHPGGPGVAMMAGGAAQDRLSEPGVGLGEDGWRVLTYAQLRNAGMTHAPEPSRALELHLTSNMERYMWSFDGVKFSDVDGPIVFEHGERLRLVLVNDTMMEHPIHLHGMFVELDNGAGHKRPLKHTLNVKPGERMSVLVTADEPGDWAFHCHLLYHMVAGMMRVVSVRKDGDVAASAHAGHGADKS